MHTRLGRFAGALLAALLAAAVVAGAARAADRIYWVNQGANTISFAAVDGSESGNLELGGVPVSKPNGLAIDTAGQRIFWANEGTGRIAFTSLFGLGGENFETGELPIEHISGLAVDPVGERVYWVNRKPFGGAPKEIAFAFLDGSFADTFGNLGDAVLGDPTAVAVDPGAGRIYWSDAGGAAPISYANLDGSGGGRINAPGATSDGALGVAVDHANGRVYWANFLGNKISFANLDGSGGGDLPTGAATVSGPAGIAVDPAGGRVYWTNSQGNKISFANLDGSGGGDLSTGTVTPSQPKFPVLFFAPRAVSPPQIDGRPQVGSVLSCSLGGWAPDALGSLLYRAPQSFKYQWSRDGIDVPGATGATIAADASGVYACRVTARNRAGDTVQASSPLRVEPIAFAKRTLVTLRLASPRVSAAGDVAIRVTNANPFPVTGRLSAAAGARKLRPRQFKVGAHGKAVVKLALPPLARRGAGGKPPPVTLSATVADLAGNHRLVRRTVKPRAGR